MNRHWAVVETKYREECATAQRAIRQGFTVYHPQYRLRRNIQGTRRVLSLFDRMFFVLLSKKSLQPIFNTRGVQRILTVGDCMGRVADSEIQRFRDLECPLGYVIVKGEEPPAYDLRSAVKFRHSGMELEGKYLGRLSAKLAKVSFVMMGQEVSVEVQSRDLVAA